METLLHNANLIQVVTRAIREEGYYIWHGFLTNEAIEMLRGASLQLLSSPGPHLKVYKRSMRVWNLMNYDETFVSVLFDHRLRSAITAILGRGYLLSDYSLNIVFPKGHPDKVHMDYPFNDMLMEIAHGILGLQCIIALDDFTLENGATEFVPNSHRKYRLPQSTDLLEFEKFVAPKGSLLIMAASTWHRAGINHSDANRMAILLSFVERWVRPMTSLDELSPEMIAKASDELKMLLGVLKGPEEIDGVPIVHRAVF